MKPAHDCRSGIRRIGSMRRNIGTVDTRQPYTFCGNRWLSLVSLANVDRNDAGGCADGTIVAGGEAVAGDGYFIAPTIVRGLADDARLVREEQFGPVLPILADDDLDDAIARANDTDYGLGGTVWTSDVERGIAVASRIDTGTVWVNKFLELPFDIRFGGAKQSGIGSQGGVEGLEEYTQARIVNANLG